MLLCSNEHKLKLLCIQKWQSEMKRSINYSRVNSKLITDESFFICLHYKNKWMKCSKSKAEMVGACFIHCSIKLIFNTSVDWPQPISLMISYTTLVRVDCAHEHKCLFLYFYLQVTPRCSDWSFLSSLISHFSFAPAATFDYASV